jgi:RelA/SpoT family (p)ppGpp synthetase
MQWTEFRSHLRHLPHSGIERVKRAFELGQISHAGQTRRSGEPYFSHPVAVADLLADSEADADTLIAALLHDTIEDTELKLSSIEKQFGTAVASLIDGVTKLSSHELPPEKPSLNEQIETLRKMFRLMQRDIRIMVIKLYDRLHNMQTVQFLPSEKQKVLAQETIDVYVKIADRLCMQDVRDEMEGLCLSVLEPEMYLQLMELRSRNEERMRAVIHTMHDALLHSHPGMMKRISIHMEPATWQRRRSQLEAAGATVTGQTPLSAAIICRTIDECYQILGILHQHWKREITSFQDYINSPAINGYRGLHTTVLIGDGTRIRCKIRTEEMHEYARKGIATRCFREEGTDLAAALPWMQRLTPLTEDTTDRSAPFWESLQSDILGESIAIHGPDDQAFSIPRDSTVLDGVFHLFPQRALSLQSVKVNGQEVRFNAPLKHADSLEAAFAEDDTVQRDWLSWVHTGFAAAQIHAALSTRSEEERMSKGRHLLEQLLLERRRAFLDEFDVHLLEQTAVALGFTTANALYAALADGRIEASDVYDAIFSHEKKRKQSKRRRNIIRYTVLMEDLETMDRVNGVHRKFREHLLEVRYSRASKGSSTTVSVKARLNPKEQTELVQALTDAGALNIEVIIHTKRSMASLAAIIILWGINPVIAKWFLEQGMTVHDLVVIRLLTFSIFSMLLFTVWQLQRGKSYSPIRGVWSVTILPAMGFLGMSAFNVLAVDVIAPSLHLAILRLNTVMLPVLALLRPKKGGMAESLIALALLVTACLTIFRFFPPAVGVASSLAALIAYTLYSLTTDRAMQVRRISVRSPVFSLKLGILLGLAGIMLMFIPGGRVILPTTQLVLFAALYILLCVCIPHALYPYVLQRLRFRSITDLFLIEVPIAVGAEWLLLGIKLSSMQYLIIVTILTTLLLFRWKNLLTHAP